ncbi:IPT/TIG domain-containing protein [Cyclobacterium salsum]|uniref:IPT/TIG domain-containing protein n=1 Tax=Cyclobacterium salsum TaxID=2666329 RepID=UPI0013914067|nr:IPT/TIG domain-containing protein [Cyclobacterium salsum]
MKKQLILSLSFIAFCMNACVEVDPFTDRKDEMVSLPAIYSINPSSAECGAEITLYGESFETSPSENFVTFDPWGSEAHSGRIAEVTNVLHAGMVMVKIPMNLAPGNYAITMMANGKSHRCGTPLKIFGD